MRPNSDLETELDKIEAAKRNLARKAGGKNGVTRAVPAPASSVEIVTDDHNILRAALDFRMELGVVTVAVQTKQDSTPGWSPLAVTSNRETALVGGRAVRFGEREYVFENPPLASPSLARWAWKDIERFCAGEPVDAAATFRRVLTLQKKYLDYPHDGIAETLALWTIGTYLHPLFPAYPYIELNAPRGSGKTKQLQLLAQTAFNGRLVVVPTEASTFRLIEDTRGTICFDEAETFDKDQKAALLQILNAGYTASGSVARCEDRTFKVREYRVFSPKAFASIRGIDSTTATRCIRIQMLRTTDRSRGNLAVTENGEDWAEIRHGLYSFALTHFKAVREIFQTDDVRPFANRQNELWSPLLSLAVFLEQHGVVGLSDTVKKLARATVEQDTDSGLAPFDEAVVQALHAQTENCEPATLSPKQILEAMRKDDGDEFKEPTAHSVGHVLKRLGFPRRKHSRGGALYQISRQQVLDVAKRYSVELGDIPEKNVTNVTSASTTSKSPPPSTHSS